MDLDSMTVTATLLYKGIPYIRESFFPTTGTNVIINNASVKRSYSVGYASSLTYGANLAKIS